MDVQISNNLSDKIVHDIANTELSSYQIAYKHNVHKSKVDRIGKAYLGDDIYNRKEQLAFRKLQSEIISLRESSFSLSTISTKLGIYRSTLFGLIKNFNLVQNSSQDKVEIVSLNSKNHNEPIKVNEISSNNELPSPIVKNYEKDVSSTSEIRESQHYRRRNNNKFQRNDNYYNHDYSNRNNRYFNNNQSVIRLKGIRIIFDSSKENIDIIIGKIVKIIQEQE